MTDTSGTQGQESGNQQGGVQGQESGASGTGQESGQQQTTQTPGSDSFDPTTIQDPTLRAWAVKVDKDAREARQEAGRYRTERNTLQTQVETFQRSQETAEQAAEREKQEAAAERETLRQENRTLKVTTATESAAATAKAHNPATVAAMIAAKVTLGDDGKPNNVADLIADLKRTDPYLFKRTSQDAGEGRGQEQTPTGGMNDVIRGALAARRGRTSSTP